MHNEEISTEMWNEWVRDPVTRSFFDALREERNAVRDSIPHIDPKDQSELIGRIMRLSALEDILQISLEDE